MKPNLKPNKSKKFRIAAKDREYLTTNLALLVKGGVPIGEALQSLSQSTKSQIFKKAITQITRDIDDGKPLWQALENSGVLSEQTLALIRLGEESGNLANNLQVASKQEQKQRLFHTKVRSALLYPGFVLCLMLVVGTGMSWFLLPKLSVTFTQLHVGLPLITRLFLGVGNFLLHNGIWAVPGGLLSLALVLFIVFAAPKTKRIGNVLLLHAPGISQLLHEIEIARFGYLLSTLLDAGLGVTKALDLLEKSTTTHSYQKFYHYLSQEVENGSGFRAALQKYKNASRLLPVNVQQLMIAGERSGSLSETLALVGVDYEAKADISTSNLEVILEPILLIIVAIGVLGLAIAVILPIYKLTSSLSP